MFEVISEIMRANVIAIEEAEVPLKELKLSLGHDGGTTIGRE